MWKQTNAQLACLSQIVERRLNESPAFLSQRLYSTLLSSKTREKAKAFANIGLNQTTSKHGEMSNLLPCCHSWRKMQKCVLFCRARSWHTSLRLNTRQEHSENSNLNKWQTNWTKKKRQQNALGGFFTPWRVCTLLVARCSLRWGFWGFGSARCFISSCRISLRKASTWRQHGSTCHVWNMSTCQPHYNTLSSCTSRVRHVKAEVTDSWEIFIRIDKVTKQYSRDSWKKGKQSCQNPWALLMSALPGILHANVLALEGLENAAWFLPDQT